MTEREGIHRRTDGEWTATVDLGWRDGVPNYKTYHGSKRGVQKYLNNLVELGMIKPFPPSPQVLYLEKVVGRSSLAEWLPIICFVLAPLWGAGMFPSWATFWVLCPLFAACGLYLLLMIWGFYSDSEEGAMRRWKYQNPVR